MKTMQITRRAIKVHILLEAHISRSAQLTQATVWWPGS